MTEPGAEAARQTETARTRWLDATWQATTFAWIEGDAAGPREWAGNVGGWLMDLFEPNLV